MVKNQQGGNKAKRQGRKFVGTTSSKLRVALEEGETYAIVTKHFGNGMVDVMCIDNINRLCIIRNKFRGRGKRDNCVNIGTWVLIGEREWEATSSDKKPKCDLLEVYNSSDVEQLKKTPNNWHILTSAVETEKKLDLDDSVNFVDSETIGYIDNHQNDVNTLPSVVEHSDDEIDFNDI